MFYSFLYMGEPHPRLPLLFRVVQLSVTPWTVAHQAPLSMRFSRQEFWSGLTFPPPGDLPDPGIKPTPPALPGGFFTAEPSGKPTDTPKYISRQMGGSCCVAQGAQPSAPRGPRGWDGAGGGRRVQREGPVYACGWFMLMYGRDNTVKQLSSN